MKPVLVISHKNKKIFEGPLKLDKTPKSKIVKKLNSTTKKYRKELRKHFKQGAWRINAGFYRDMILQDIFGIDASLRMNLLLAQSAPGLELQYTEEGAMLVNTRDKVFYDTVRSRLYVDKQMRNLITDIQLGDL